MTTMKTRMMVLNLHRLQAHQAPPQRIIISLLFRYYCFVIDFFISDRKHVDSPPTMMKVRCWFRYFVDQSLTLFLNLDDDVETNGKNGAMYFSFFLPQTFIYLFIYF